MWPLNDMHQGLNRQLPRPELGLYDIVIRFMWPAKAEVSQLMANICIAETRPGLTGLKLQDPPRFAGRLLRDAGSCISPSWQ